MVALPNSGKINVAVECSKCKNVYMLRVRPQDLEAWQNGKLIQDAMHYLSADDRELLMTRICGSCFDKMFGGES